MGIPSTDVTACPPFPQILAEPVQKGCAALCHLTPCMPMWFWITQPGGGLCSGGGGASESYVDSLAAADSERV